MLLSQYDLRWMRHTFLMFASLKQNVNDRMIQLAKLEVRGRFALGLQIIGCYNDKEVKKIIETFMKGVKYEMSSYLTGFGT